MSKNFIKNLEEMKRLRDLEIHGAEDTQKMPEAQDAFRYTTAISKLRKIRTKTKIKIVPGGTSAGKTFGIIPILIDDAIRIEFSEISIASANVPHLKKGAMKDFKKIMQASGRWDRKKWHDTDRIYRFDNGSYIEFIALDDEMKARGPRRTHLYVNEANMIDFEIFRQLLIRTSVSIWIDFNPSAEFWAHEHYSDDPRATWLTLTYKDNEGLPQSIVEEIEMNKFKAFHNPNLPDNRLFDKPNIKSSYWANWWAVYGMGQLGRLEGAVFNNWKTIKGVPMGSQLIGYCMDFGYVNDPTTILAVYLYKGRMIIDELLYQNGLLSTTISNFIKGVGIRNNVFFVADNQKIMIDEVNKHGHRIVPAWKPKDGIETGIEIMQGFDIYITERSKDTIKEFTNYRWMVTKDGKAVNKPEDKNNHSIDAVRYLALLKLRRGKLAGRARVRAA